MEQAELLQALLIAPAGDFASQCFNLLPLLLLQFPLQRYIAGSVGMTLHMAGGFLWLGSNGSLANLVLSLKNIALLGQTNKFKFVFWS